MKERRSTPMEMEERDVVTFTDEEGNEFELDVIEYFEYEGQEYAVLMDLSAEAEDEEEAAEVYIMKIVQMDDDMEEFVPVEDDSLLEKLIAIVQRRFDGEEIGDDPDEEI